MNVPAAALGGMRPKPQSTPSQIRRASAVVELLIVELRILQRRRCWKQGAAIEAAAIEAAAIDPNNADALQRRRC